MKSVERVNGIPCEGYLLVERIFKNGTTEVVFHEKNLVVNLAAKILRDLMYGTESERIIKIHFGDMNLNESSNLKQVAPPNLTDESLLNKLYEKEATRSLVDYDGNPAITYVTTLNEEEFNGTGEQIITEYALATSTNRIFTRKTRAAVYKDNESSLKFTWTLVFT